MNPDLATRIINLTGELLSPDWVRATLLLALIAAGQLLAVCAYLWRYTRKAHFGMWSLACLFFVGYLVASFSFNLAQPRQVAEAAELASLGMSGLFLLLGALHLGDRRPNQFLLAVGVSGILLWSVYAAFELPHAWWNVSPPLALFAGACVWSGVHYARERPATRASKLLALAWFIWGFSALAFSYVGVFAVAKALEQVLTPVVMLLVGMALMLKEEATFSEDKYRGVMDATTDSMFIVDLWTQHVLDANKAACRLSKYPREELLLRTFLELCPDLRKNGDSLLDLRNMFNAVFKPYSEFHIVRADQTPVICEGDATLAQWRKRAVIQLTVREVDKSRTANQLMRRTEKLSSLGQLVAGVAHELNNPLAVVMGYAQVMAKDEALDDKTKANITRILHESERAAKIVRDLLSFARPCEPQMTTVDINRLICNVLDIRESDLRGHHIQDQVYLAPDLPLTKGDAIQIEQVINNLISNAIHALDVKPQAERRLKITTEVSGFFVRVTITDSGPGIPAAVRDKIFDPFFTTKAPGKGTGLGLSISNTIVQEHHGRIWFESEPDRWTEFYVEFPIVPVGEPARAPQVKPVEEPQISIGAVLQVHPEPTDPVEQRLLVVDDEPGIRDVLKDVLSCSGYAVDTAANGSEAMRQLSANRYDLIISDLCMPEMDGEALFKAIQVKDARLAGRIIFVTGDTVSPKSREFLEQSGNRWLSKPFNIRDVEDTVRSVLGGALQEVH